MTDHSYVALFGDLHNHCGISYGHGSLEEALANAALRLDFVSITGHADWPDMDTNDPRIAHIVDFHLQGFAKLRSGWDQYLKSVADFEAANRLVTFPGYEIHSNEHGDYTIVGRDHDLPLVLADTPVRLREALAGRFGDGGTAAGVMLFPHHIGYRRGARGVNWSSFQEAFSPIVEICSMHGFAESDESDRPFLHSMGPAQSYGTMNHGLLIGKRFGVSGNTDHHSGHPGSYGHGMTGVWAESSDRTAIWEALYARRTWAMTGDAVRLWFSYADVPMGGVVGAEGGAAATSASNAYPGLISVDATAPIDYVELVADGTRRRLWWRPPEAEGSASSRPAATSGQSGHPGPAAGASVRPGPVAQPDEAVFKLELGWGERGKIYNWNVDIAISGGEILELIPQFRGPEVVSPLDAEGAGGSTHHAEISANESRRVAFTTATWGNMTNSTPSTQGVALRISSPQTTSLEIRMDDRVEKVMVRDLLESSRSGNLGPIDSPAFRMTAFPPRSYRWECRFGKEYAAGAGWLYARVRMKNGHWAISSPIWLEG